MRSFSMTSLLLHLGLDWDHSVLGNKFLRHAAVHVRYGGGRIVWRGLLSTAFSDDALQYIHQARGTAVRLRIMTEHCLDVPKTAKLMR